MEKKQPKDKAQRARAFKNGAYASALCCVMAAVVVALNLFVGALPKKYTQLDLTDNGLYSLSEETKQVCEGLTADVTLYYLARTGQEDAAVWALLEKYEELSPHIKVVQKDPVLYPTFGSAYGASGANMGSVIVDGGDRYRVVDYYDIYQQTVNYTTYSYDTSFDGEGQLTGALTYVSSEVLPRLYTLDGHGEAALSTALASGLTRKNMETETLTLLTVDAVPADADAVILNAPQKDLSEAEAQKLADYLTAGGSLFVVTDYGEYNAEMQPNLTALLEQYGLFPVDGIVVETDQNRYLSGYPYYLLPDVCSHAITSPLVEAGSYVLAPLAHGIALAETLPGGVTASALLQTGSGAYVKANAYDGGAIAQADGDPTGTFALAAAAENETTGARVVWLATSGLLDESMDSAVSGANSDFVLNSFSWLADAETAITISAKSLTEETLTVTASAGRLWSNLFTLVLPGGLLVAGFVIWLWRRKR